MRLWSRPTAITDDVSQTYLVWRLHADIAQPRIHREWWHWCRLEIGVSFWGVDRKTIYLTLGAWVFRWTVFRKLERRRRWKPAPELRLT